MAMCCGYESIKTEVFNFFYGLNAEPMLMAICCVARAERAVGVQRQVVQIGRNSDG